MVQVQLLILLGRENMNNSYFFVDNIQRENTKAVEFLLPGPSAHRVKSAAVIEENIH